MHRVAEPDKRQAPRGRQDHSHLKMTKQAQRGEVTCQRSVSHLASKWYPQPRASLAREIKPSPHNPRTSHPDQLYSKPFA